MKIKQGRKRRKQSKRKRQKKERVSSSTKAGEKGRAAYKERREKETEQILLAISEQMVAIEQLRVQTKLLYQYIQKYKSYIKNTAI